MRKIFPKHKVVFALIVMASMSGIWSFSHAAVVNSPTDTPTITPSSTRTPTFTATSTITRTSTPTYTRTHTPTCTATRTITRTFTPTPTRTPTFTITPTYTVTSTYTLTYTPTGTRTATMTVTPTFTITPTITPTSTITLTPTPTTTAHPSDNLDRVIVFPNPYIEIKSAFKRINFIHLTFNASLKVYNLSGELVWEAEKNDGSDRIEWKGVTNMSGRKLSSGIYLYVIQNDEGQRRTGKLAILR